MELKTEIDLLTYQRSGLRPDPHSKFTLHPNYYHQLSHQRLNSDQIPILNSSFIQIITTN